MKSLRISCDPRIEVSVSSASVRCPVRYTLCHTLDPILIAPMTHALTLTLIHTLAHTHTLTLAFTLTLTLTNRSGGNSNP
jgi:hypothetical protein